MSPAQRQSREHSCVPSMAAAGSGLQEPRRTQRSSACRPQPPSSLHHPACATGSHPHPKPPGPHARERARPPPPPPPARSPSSTSTPPGSGSASPARTCPRSCKAPARSGPRGRLAALGRKTEGRRKSERCRRQGEPGAQALRRASKQRSGASPRSRGTHQHLLHVVEYFEVLPRVPAAWKRYARDMGAPFKPPPDVLSPFTCPPPPPPNNNKKTYPPNTKPRRRAAGG
jgi:hypothetical protein